MRPTSSTRNLLEAFTVKLSAKRVVCCHAAGAGNAVAVRLGVSSMPSSLASTVQLALARMLL